MFEWLKRFLKNTRAESVGADIGAILGMIIGSIFYIYLIPTFVDAVTGIDTAAWNFTGYQGAVAILFLLPLVFIAGVAIYIVKKILT